MNREVCRVGCDWTSCTERTIRLRSDPIVEFHEVEGGGVLSKRGSKLRDSRGAFSCGGGLGVPFCGRVGGRGVLTRRTGVRSFGARGACFFISKAFSHRVCVHILFGRSVYR